jgi:hypothetical protein
MPTHIAPQKITQIQQLLAAGLPPRRIAEKVGVRSQVVYYHRNKLNGAGPLKEEPNAGISSAEVDPAEISLNNHTSYAFGHTQAWLDIYAQSLNLPTALLAHRVGELLSRSTRGQVVGLEYRVPRVPGAAPAGAGVRAPQVALALGAPGRGAQRTIACPKCGRKLNTRGLHAHLRSHK